MRPTLWVLLAFIAYEVSVAKSEPSSEEYSEAELSHEETSLSNEVGQSSDLESSVLMLANDIYDKQKVCDAYVGQAVVDAIEAMTSNELPKPDEKYIQCMRSLDELKRQYIKSFLVGLNYQSNGFPIRISSEHTLTLPSPTEGTIREFDVQQQLCMTNNVCNTLEHFTVENFEDVLNQQKYKVRCLDFLNNVKLKYVASKKLDDDELGKNKGLSIVCREGEITLSLPKRTGGVDDDVIAPTISAEETQIIPEGKNVEEHKDQTQATILADAIFDKQKECDAFVGEAVVKAVEKYISKKFPVPDERYIQCMKTLNELKREYINTYLLGQNYYSKMFPMVLSSKRFITLPVPADDDSLSTGADFDSQQELCMTNKLCLTLVRERFSNVEADDIEEQKKSVSRCLDFFNDLKIKYIDLKKIDRSELKKGQGLSIMCTNGETVLALPEEKVSGIYDSYYHSETPNITPTTVNYGGNEKLDNDKQKTYGEAYNDVIKELKSGNEKRTDEETDGGQDSDEDETNVESVENKHQEEDEQGKNTVVEIAVNESETKSDESANENQNTISGNQESKLSSGDQKPEDAKERSGISNYVGLSHRNEEVSDTSVDKSLSNTASRETKASFGGTSNVANKEEKTTGTMSEINRSEGEKNKGNGELVNLRMKGLSQKDDGNVETQASGQEQKSGIGNPASKQQGLSSINEIKSKQLKSLEDNIYFIENDCKELLTFGEKLLQHKILSSMINLESHYNDCIEKLDTLKKIYIEKEKLDVTSHRNFFPLTLSTGEAKLVSLPSQFVKTDQAEPTASNSTPDVPELASFFRGSDQSGDSFRIRKPFDNPALITNDEFYRSLQRDSDESMFSKVTLIPLTTGEYADEYY